MSSRNWQCGYAEIQVIVDHFGSNVCEVFIIHAKTSSSRARTSCFGLADVEGRVGRGGASGCLHLLLFSLHIVKLGQCRW